jgi:hypothetical protein
MRHIYAFHGHPISEELLLGLGAGVGFVYWHMKGTAPFIGGRGNTGRPGEEGLEVTATHRTGVRVEAFHTASAPKAEKALLTMLEAGEPVMIYVDMGLLPYFHFPVEYHFGGHMVVVAGYNAETYQVLIADRDGEPHPVALDDLARARSSPYKPFPPQNKWFTFDFSGQRPPAPDEVRTAIREATGGMLDAPISNLGVRGIQEAAKRVLKWPAIMSEEDLRFACFNAFIFIDATGGTGGGIFRLMYGRFLDEAADITGDNRLAEVGAEMRAIGEQWQEVARVFHAAQAAPAPGKLLPEATTLMTTIAEREEAAWKRLRALVDA